MSKEINLEKIWHKVLNSYDMNIDYDLRGHDAILTAMKTACDKVLDLAAENIVIKYDNDHISIDNNSILQIKDWIKQK